MSKKGVKESINLKRMSVKVVIKSYEICLLQKTKRLNKMSKGFSMTFVTIRHRLY